MWWLLLLLLLLPFPGVIVCFHIEWRWGTRSMCHWRSKANQSCWGWAQNSLLQSLPTINLSEPQSDFYLILVILISNLRSWSTQRRVVVLALSSSSRCRLYSHLEKNGTKCAVIYSREKSENIIWLWGLRGIDNTSTKYTYSDIFSDVFFVSKCKSNFQDNATVVVSILSQTLEENAIRWGRQVQEWRSFTLREVQRLTSPQTYFLSR